MPLFDFRTVDLIDRMDWNDPDFQAAVQMLISISEVVNVKAGQVTVKTHVIPINGTPAVLPKPE